MDLNDLNIADEVSALMRNLWTFLPTKKETIIEHRRVKLTRLSEVHAEAKRVFPTCFVGAKLIIYRQIMDKVNLVQQYNYGREKYAQHNCFTKMLDREQEPLAIDGLTIDSGGAATATYTEPLEGGYDLRVVSKIKDLISSEVQMTVEKERAKSIGSFSFSMRDVDPKTMKLVSHYMHKVFDDFSVGAEVSFKPLRHTEAPKLAISARYEKENLILSSSVSRFGFQACMFKRFAPDLRIATIVNEGDKGGAVVGLSLHKSYMNGSDLKIFVDSERCGGFTYEKNLYFDEGSDETRMLRLVVSTLIDKERKVRFGFGCNLDF